MAVRVVLIDDEKDARVSLTRRFRRSEDFDLVGAARDVSEAAGVLHQDAPDVVVLNVRRRDGEVEHCRAICRLTDAPLVLLASFMTVERWQEMRNAGAVDYILKRVDTRKLGQKLVSIVQRRT